MYCTSKIPFTVHSLGFTAKDAILHGGELPESKRRQILELLAVIGSRFKWRLRNVCRALVYLHEQGPSMLHGDLSPKNILLRAGSFYPVLVDFGMSALRKSRQKMVGGADVKMRGCWSLPEVQKRLQLVRLRPLWTLRPRDSRRF